MNLLEVNNVSKTYGQGKRLYTRIEGRVISVPKGEFVAIVGESGSGKKYAAEYGRGA